MEYGERPKRYMVAGEAALLHLYGTEAMPEAESEERATVTLSGKHQVTLPAGMVRELGLRAGDKLSVRLRGQDLVMTRQPRTPEEWVARYRGALKGVYGKTAEEIDAYIREERESWDRRSS